MYRNNQKFGKLNKLNVFGSQKTEGLKQDSQNRLTLPEGDTH
jgi:hypothetical protein